MKHISPWEPTDFWSADDAHACSSAYCVICGARDLRCGWYDMMYCEWCSVKLLNDMMWFSGLRLEMLWLYVVPVICCQALSRALPRSLCVYHTVCCCHRSWSRASRFHGSDWICIHTYNCIYYVCADHSVMPSYVSFCDVSCSLYNLCKCACVRAAFCCDSFVCIIQSWLLCVAFCDVCCIRIVKCIIIMLWIHACIKPLFSLDCKCVAFCDDHMVCIIIL